LHVVGQRANGYHELQSLVCLTEFGDQIHLSPAADFSFQVIGPNASGIPVDESNLVVQAAKFMAQKHSKSLDCQIILEKNLPMASGIGGGSSDAAAVMRALSQYFSVPLPNVDELMTLGADIPVCMTTGLTLMEGAGEVPEVGAVVDAISAAPHCQMARMSGSGATCFGVFADIKHANAAAERLQRAHPDWWVVSTKIV